MAVATLILLLTCSCLYHQAHSVCTGYYCPKTCTRDDCISPTGDDCTWYTYCLDFCNPCPEDNNYATQYGQVYCEKYSDNYNQFSDKGKRWIEEVRKCLQIAIAPDYLTPLGCTELKEKAFDSHAECYANPGDESFCDLSCSDIAHVLWTVKGAFVHQPWQTIKQSGQTYWACRKRGTSSCIAGAEFVGAAIVGVASSNPVFRLVRFAVSSVKSLFTGRRKRSVEEDQQRLVEQIVAEVFSNIDLALNASIGWFVFSNETANDELEVKILISDRRLLFNYENGNESITVNYNTLVAITDDVIGFLRDEKSVTVNGTSFPIGKIVSCADEDCKMKEEVSTGSVIYSYGWLITPLIILVQISIN